MRLLLPSTAPGPIVLPRQHRFQQPLVGIACKPDRVALRQRGTRQRIAVRRIIDCTHQDLRGRRWLRFLGLWLTVMTRPAAFLRVARLATLGGATLGHCSAPSFSMLLRQIPTSDIDVEWFILGLLPRYCGYQSVAL